MRRVADLDALLGQERVGLAGGEAVVGAALLGEVAGDQHAVDVGRRARQPLQQLAEGAGVGQSVIVAGWPAPRAPGAAAVCSVSRRQQLIEPLGIGPDEALAALDLELALRQIDAQSRSLLVHFFSLPDDTGPI